MEYDEVEFGSKNDKWGKVRILETKEGCDLQFSTKDPNNKKIDLREIEEYSLTTDEATELSDKIKNIIKKIR